VDIMGSLRLAGLSHPHRVATPGGYLDGASQTSGQQLQVRCWLCFVSSLVCARYMAAAIVNG
jgi:hypothetical protein